MILVFAGAGASKALDPNGYPTTEEFFQRLPDEIKGNPVFKSVTEFIRSRLGRRTIDIEEWLWNAGAARKVFETFGDGSNPAGWFLEQNRLHSVVGVGGSSDPAVNAGRSLARHLLDLEDQVNQQIYEFYSPQPTAEALSATWLALLKPLLMDWPGAVEIFTTNYDVVLETAIETANLPIETGRMGGIYPRLREEMWRELQAESRQSRGMLTKLHGSVDWTLSKSGNIHTGTPVFGGRHKDRAIIYPGFKGIPEERPFALFHEHLVKSVSKADVILFVGFAFRDDYINRILRDQLPPSTLVVSINPASPLQSPFRQTQQVVQLAQRFNREGIESALAEMAVSLVAAGKQGVNQLSAERTEPSPR